jgi:hypothetical protein
LGIVVGTCACTASKDITQAQQQLRQIEDVRQFNMEQVRKPLSEYRKGEEDEVLYHLEHGMLEHFRREWAQSSKHLKSAQRAIEENYTKSINRNLQSMLVNDLQLPYRGEAYEDIYLNTIKSLNYLHRDDLEGAMVEARKVTHDLSMLSDRYKGLAESVQRDTAQTAVNKVDQKLEEIDLLGGEEQEAPIEIQQNSALSRFLTTVLYAKRGQGDDARIEFRKLRTALTDQGDTEFLATLSDVAAAKDESGAPTGDPRTESSVTLRLRATPEAGGDVPPLQFYVNGRGVYTVSPSDMEQTNGRYAVEVTGVPAAPHDSIAVVPEASLTRPLRLEVWSDSLQFRDVLAAETSEAAFALGRPEIHPSSPGHSQSASRRQEERANASGLQPVRLSYAHTRSTTTGIQQFEARRVLETTGRSPQSDWRVVEHVEPSFGATGGSARRVDTMRLGRDSLQLQRYSHHRSQTASLHVRRDGGAFVEAASSWNQQPVRVGHAGPAYGEGIGVEMALSTRSLAVGETFSLPVYVSGQRQVQTVHAHVVKTDSVTTPAGPYSVYVVRVRPPSAHRGTTTLYLRKAFPHHVVQARTRLPVFRGERRDTVIVRRSLTRLTQMEASAPAAAPPVASADPPPPPQNLPSVSVSTATESRSESAAGRLVPTPQQLTNPTAYNALLVSFSGRAPKKRERSFSFSFVIDEEEYELNFAIPVLELSGTKVERVRAVVAGDTVRVPLIEEMQQVARAMFAEKKPIVYTRAVTRSFLKAAATKGAAALAENQGGAGAGWLVKQAGQMASGYVAEADTRGWQTMPGFAYATVLNLPSGSHDVTFEYLSGQGTVLERRTRTIEVASTRDLALAESIVLE